MPSKPNARQGLSLVSIALSATLLTACQSTPSSRVMCPPLATYAPAFQTQAASELRALPAGAAVGQLVTDYGKLRDACRAIERRR
jgi:hypothetical protein